ncbi:MAG: undecaprenyl-phosphate galactose phosphotransferase WbaP [Pirellulales bacterium]
MSHLDSGNASEENPQDSDEGWQGVQTAVSAEPSPQSIAQSMRPRFQGVTPARARVLGVAAGQLNGGVNKDFANRRVGFEFIRQLVLTGAPFMLADLAVLVAVIGAAKYLMLFFGLRPLMDLSGSVLPIAAGFVVIATELGLYPGIRTSPVDEFRRLAVTATSLFVVWIIGIAILTGGQLAWQRCLYIALAYGMCLPLLPASRSAIRSILAKWRWWGFPTLVCGNDSAAVQVYDWLANNKRLGLRPVGVIADREELEIEGDESWYAGSWSEANEVAKQKGAYWAVVVPPAGASAAFWVVITNHLSTIPHIHLLSELTGLPDYGGPRQQLEGLAGIHLQHNLMLPLPRLSKRLMDIVGALFGGLVLMPLLFYIAVAVKLSSRGPVLYANERIGRDGRRFHMWKFRSMFTHGDAVLEDYLELHPECRDEWQTTHKLRDDPRITRIGRFIRKTSLDELPQLWNVLRGEMSLVGPRPILLEEQAKYGDCYSLYTMVSPGITGLWQVSGRSDASYDERLQFVSYYVHNWSLWLDIYLLLRTVRIVLFGKGAY